jgi:hypothetical protein
MAFSGGWRAAEQGKYGAAKNGKNEGVHEVHTITRTSICGTKFAVRAGEGAEDYQPSKSIGIITSLRRMNQSVHGGLYCASEAGPLACRW